MSTPTIETPPSESRPHMTTAIDDHATRAEQARVEAVHQLELVDTAPEERFDKIVRMAQELFDVPMVAINLIDEHDQFTKATTDEAFMSRTMPREESFCSTTIQEDGSLIVVDATQDARFAGNPLVTGDEHVRFYAGHPLTNQGHRVGALCLVDTKPRTFTAVEQRILSDLAAWVERELIRDAEMTHAAEVQQSLLPRNPPVLAGYDTAGACVTAQEVGGDFYGWQATDNQLFIMLADAMGKGVGPALLAAGLRAAIRATFTGDDIGADFNHAAASVEEDLTSTSTFITAFTAQIEATTGLVSYVDAGHGLTIMVSTDGKPRRLPTTGLPLGVMTGDSWQVHQQQLCDGETLVVISDGIIDLFEDTITALNYLAEVVTDTTTAQDAVDAIVSYANSHTSGGQDDLTLIVVRRD